MSKKESRRIVPLSAVAIAAFAILVVFEALVIGGILEIKASTVARIAPWAYEPFLRFVGEHPESESMKGSVGYRTGQEADALSDMASIAGFDPDGVIIDATAQTDEDDGAGEIVPAGDQSITVPEESPQTNSIPDRPEEVMPVG